LTCVPFSDTLKKVTCIAMKLILFLIMMAGVPVTLVADEPKASPQRSVEEIDRQIEILKARMEALNQEKKLLQKKSDEISKFWSPVHLKENPEGQYGYIIVDPTNFGVITKTIETNGANYMTPRMSMEMAERHSAEKIKAQMREADAKATRILDGHPPSQVHGN
jgi:hypothetical protein